MHFRLLSFALWAFMPNSVWAPLMGISADPPTSVASHSCVRKPVEPTEEKEEEEMNHYMDFDPYLIRERNEKLRREVSTYRLEKRLRQNREPRSGRFVVFVSRGASPLLRKAGLAG